MTLLQPRTTRPLPLHREVAHRISKDRTLKASLQIAAAQRNVNKLIGNKRLMDAVAQAVRMVPVGNVWGRGGNSRDIKATTHYIVDQTGLLLEKRESNHDPAIIYRKENGNEIRLAFHDQELDMSILERKVLGKRVLILVSDANINAMLRFSQADKLVGKRNFSFVALSSKGGYMDYAVSYLHATFGVSRDDMPLRNKDYEA